ncbi:MAG: hypothetical protein HFF07_01500 [Oscillospiraceae bacterium]|nr:hypothetical protein [Oscillospiraceae bacterium]
MKQIQNAILKMDTDLTSEEFSTLCHALYEMRASFPDPPMMKVICSDIKVKANKTSPSSVSKSLERAVHRIFEHGDRQILASYQRSRLFEQPAPNKFIRTVAMHLYNDLTPPSSETGWLTTSFLFRSPFHYKTKNGCNLKLQPFLSLLFTSYQQPLPFRREPIPI